MIISVPPLKQTETSEEKTEEKQPDSLYNYEYHMVPADGIQVPDDQYIVDPDYWFRNFDSNFEDLIKIKR